MKITFNFDEERLMRYLQESLEEYIIDSRLLYKEVEKNIPKIVRTLEAKDILFSKFQDALKQINFEDLIIDSITPVLREEAKKLSKEKIRKILRT